MTILAFTNTNTNTFWTNKFGEELPFVPNPGAVASFMEDYTHRYIGLFGGLGSSKSTSGIMKLLILHIHNSFDSEKQPTHVSSLLVEPTFSMLRNPGVEILIQCAEYMGLSYELKERNSEFVLTDLGTRKRPSKILLRSSETPIIGFEVGAFLIDECASVREGIENPRLDTLIQTQFRLRSPGANFLQGMMVGTNETKHTNFYRFFYEHPSPDKMHWEAKTVDNVAVADQVELMKRNVPPEFWSQYFDGGVLDLSGSTCYSAFCPEMNVSEDTKLDTCNKFSLHVTWDFGARGCHVLIGQYWKSLDEFHVVDEITAGDVRKTCLALYEWFHLNHKGFKWSDIHLFGDSSGRRKPAGGEGSESCFRIIANYCAEWKIDRRTRVRRGNPRIQDRVATLNMALVDITGKPHIKIHPRCKKLIKDLTEQKWDDDGNTLDKGDGSIGHRSDALGYWVFKVRPLKIPRANTPGGRIIA